MPKVEPYRKHQFPFVVMQCWDSIWIGDCMGTPGVNVIGSDIETALRQVDSSICVLTVGFYSAVICLR